MQPPDLSRRTIIAVVAIVAGVVVTAMALLGGSGSSEETVTASSPGKAIDPVEPLDPDDKDAAQPRDDEPEVDFTDQFDTSFGTRAKHKVTVRVTGNGYVNIGVYYRDRKKAKSVHANGFQETRTITTRYPLAAITIQLPGNRPGAATIATCTIVIDNVEVSRNTTRKPWVVEGCIG